jgi:Mg-chelatase subunit ChlI
LSLFNNNYCLTFADMQQTNLSTSFKRTIRRRKNKKEESEETEESKSESDSKSSESGSEEEEEEETKSGSGSDEEEGSDEETNEETDEETEKKKKKIYLEKKSLSKIFENYYNNEEYSDFIIKFEGKRIKKNKKKKK